MATFKINIDANLDTAQATNEAQKFQNTLKNTTNQTEDFSKSTNKASSTVKNATPVINDLKKVIGNLGGETSKTAAKFVDFGGDLAQLAATGGPLGAVGIALAAVAFAYTNVAKAIKDAEDHQKSFTAHIQKDLASLEATFKRLKNLEDIRRGFSGTEERQLKELIIRNQPGSRTEEQIRAEIKSKQAAADLFALTNGALDLIGLNPFTNQIKELNTELGDLANKKRIIEGATAELKELGKTDLKKLTDSIKEIKNLDVQNELLKIDVSNITTLQKQIETISILAQVEKDAIQERINGLNELENEKGLLSEKELDQRFALRTRLKLIGEKELQDQKDVINKAVKAREDGEAKVLEDAERTNKKKKELFDKELDDYYDLLTGRATANEKFLQQEITRETDRIRSRSNFQLQWIEMDRRNKQMEIDAAAVLIGPAETGKRENLLNYKSTQAAINENIKALEEYRGRLFGWKEAAEAAGKETQVYKDELEDVSNNLGVLRRQLTLATTNFETFQEIAIRTDIAKNFKFAADTLAVPNVFKDAVKYSQDLLSQSIESNKQAKLYGYYLEFAKKQEERITEEIKKSFNDGTETNEQAEELNGKLAVAQDLQIGYTEQLTQAKLEAQLLNDQIEKLGGAAKILNLVALKQLIVDMGDSVESTLGDAVFAGLTGRGDEIKDTFRNMFLDIGQDATKTLLNALANVLLGSKASPGQSGISGLIQLGLTAGINALIPGSGTSSTIATGAFAGSTVTGSAKTFNVTNVFPQESAVQTTMRAYQESGSDLINLVDARRNAKRTFSATV